MSNMTPKQHFGFFDLPPELPSDIYALVFGDTTAVISQKTSGERNVSKTKPPAPKTGIRFGLFRPKPSKTKNIPSKTSRPFSPLTINRQFRAEAGDIAYSTIRFVTASSTVLVRWLETLEPELWASIQYVSILSDRPDEFWFRGSPSATPLLCAGGFDLATTRRLLGRQLRAVGVEFDAGKVIYGGEGTEKGKTHAGAARVVTGPW